MQTLLMFKADATLFDEKELEQIFRSNPLFKDIRVDTPWDLVECQYVEPNDWAIIQLAQDRQAICFSDTGDAALRAVLIIQEALGVPLRLIDNVYSFDLTFKDITTVEELEAAMDNARTN